MQITLRLYVEDGDFADSMIKDINTSIQEDEGITLVTAAGRYFVELDSMEVG